MKKKMNNLQNTGVNQKAAIHNTAYAATVSLENKYRNELHKHS